MAYIDAETKRLITETKAQGLLAIAAPGLGVVEEELLIEDTGVIEGARTVVYSGATGQGKGFVLTFEYFNLETRDA